MKALPSLEILVSTEAIKRRNAQLAHAIAEDCPSGPLLIVAILNGSFVFLSDLARALYRAGLQTEIDFLVLSSYGSRTATSGEVHLILDTRLTVTDRTVLLLDDILDSGLTLAYARDLLLQRGALAVKTCVFLEKQGRRRTEIKADYIGFQVPNVFVVGYGLDYAQQYRHWPFVAKLPAQ
jgi:hypoxanthine phosphoribosyltransferase